MEKKLHFWGGLVFSCLLAVGAIVALTRKESKVSPAVIETDSLQTVYDNLRIFHRGRINDIDNDRDFDGDEINDYYVIGRDGTVYATHSSDKDVPLFRERFYKHKVRE